MDEMNNPQAPMDPAAAPEATPAMDAPMPEAAPEMEAPAMPEAPAEGAAM